MECTNCKFFQPSINKFEPAEGECHLKPPVVVVSNGKTVSVYPELFGGDWCGQYKSKK